MNPLNEASRRPILMAVDGNSLLHRAYHAAKGTNLRDSDGRPTWALKGMLHLVASAVHRIGPDLLIIGFDSREQCARQLRYPDYKATRGEKDPDLLDQVERAPKMFEYAGAAVRVPTGLEADDVTAAAARLAGDAGWHAVLVTSDRDAFAHVSDHCSVLRIVNGGVKGSPLLDPAALRELTGIAGHQYLDYAALRGDKSDNLPGVYGIGEQAAAKLLNEFGTMTAAWSALDTDPAGVIARVGKGIAGKLTADGARAAWARNVDIMAPAPLPALGLDLATRTGAGFLPLPADRVTTTCRVVGAATDSILATLCDPAPADQPGADQPRDPGPEAPHPGLVEVPASELHPAAALFDLV